MTERPILFSGPMVRAILAGAKTQTRRIVTPEPHAGVRYRPGGGAVEDGHGRPINPRYGIPGDRLWVRETFRQAPGSMSVHYAADPDEVSGGPWRPSIFMPRWASRIRLEVTEVHVQLLQEISEQDVKAEGIQLPVHKVSETHGAPLLNITASPTPSTFSQKHPRDWGLGDYWRHAFAVAWDGINGKRTPWKSNPWVWAISFRRDEAAR